MKFIKELPIKILKLPKKYLIGGIVIVFLLWFFVFSGNKNTVVPQYATVKKMDLKQEISASGVLTGKNSADLRFKSGGKLAYVNVKTGDTVTTGQILAGLDTEELTIELRQAENTLRDKRAIVDKIHDDLKDVSAESYTQRQTRTTAEVAQDNAYDSYLAAKRAFQDAIIYSPIDGTVTKSDSLPGQIVSASDTVIQVVDFSENIFETDVDEADISKILVGQKTEVTLNAYGDKVFSGEVAEIAPQTKSTSNGATVITVKVALNDTSIKKIAGLNGQASIIQAQKKNVLSIPIDSLKKDNTVLVKTGNGYRSKKVETGFKTESDVEILDGLSEGEEVITNPVEVSPAATGRSRNPLQRIFRLR